MNREKQVSHFKILAVYITFCIFILLTVTLSLRQLVTRSTNAQINNILSLMAEKVNTSFNMMSNYVIEAAEIVSTDKDINFEDCYARLQSTKNELPYTSIGLIDSSGRIYGSKGEQLDIEKQNFIDASFAEDKLFISDPYRSSVTGTNMIAMFAPIYSRGSRVGSLYAVYYLETIQNLAYTNILSDKTAVFLINPFSGNLVNCDEADGNPPGTWSNTRLIKRDIESLSGFDYDDWLKEMRGGGEKNLIDINYMGQSFAQAFVEIKGMRDWYLVIRIPLEELSDTMHRFTLGVIIGAALLVIATILIALYLYSSEHRQNETLKDLSDHDPLTKILNRRAFAAASERMFSKLKPGEQCIFMFFDIDYFKSVNDNYGHDAGDQVLCKTAKALSDAFGDTSVVARIGGDEFNVFIYKPLTVADVDDILANTRMQLKQLKLDDGTQLPLSFSAGLARYPQDADSLKTLSENADKALYHVKDEGRNNHFWYHDFK